MISKEKIRYIANFSKLNFEGEEFDKFVQDFSQIIEYVGKIQEVDTENVEPVNQVNTNIQFLREDKVKESFSNEEALSSAPDKQYGYFKLPKIID